MNSERPTVIAHLSDTHFGGKWQPAARVRRALTHLAAMDPPVDVVLVTGDIADHGTPQEYAEASAVLGEWQTLSADPAPMFFLPGNHDRREGYADFRRASHHHPVNEAHRAAGLLFVMLDSMVPAPEGERIDHGVLTAETLAWLDRQLTERAPGERAIVCLHHPPVIIHLELMDPIRLMDAQALAAVLDKHEGVVAVLTGHAHSACATSFHQMRRPLPVLVGGGLASTVVMDAEPLARLTPDLPPSYALHVIGADGHLVTHWRALPL